jgi:hypothetical protein
MDGQVIFNQPLNGLLYEISTVYWEAIDNKMTVTINFYAAPNTPPLVVKVYYIPLAGIAAFDGLAATINNLIKTEVEKDGLYTVEPLPAP